MSRSTAQKMGIKEAVRTHLVNAPDAALDAMALPSLAVSATLDGEFGYIHGFAITQAEMDRAFPSLKAHLGTTGALWV